MTTRLRLLIFAVPLLLSAPAVADEIPAGAKAHFDIAESSYKLGDFAKAIEEYRACYQIYPSPIILYNIAQAYRESKDYERARFFYQQYLDTAPPTGKYRKAAETNMTELNALIEKQNQVSTSTPRGPARSEADGHRAEQPSPVRGDLVKQQGGAAEGRNRGLWIGLGVGAAVVVVAAVVLGVVLGVRMHPDAPSTTLGNYSGALWAF